MRVARRRAALLSLALAASFACGSHAPAVTRFHVDGHPSAVTVYAHLVWVTDDVNASVHTLDPVSGRERGRPIRLARNPIAITAGGGSVWIAHAGGHVTRIRAASRTVTKRYDIGGSLTGIALAGGRVWVSDVERGVYGFEPNAPKTGRWRPFEQGAVRVIGAGGDVWVSGREHTVTRFDAQAGSSSDVDVGSGPIGMVFDGVRLWVANTDDATVTAIDVRRNDVVRTVKVGRGPVAIAYAVGTIWVANQDGASLTRIDPETGRVLGPQVHLGTSPRGVASDEAAVWVAGVNPDALVRVIP